MSRHHDTHTPLVLGEHEPAALASEADAPIVRSPFDTHRTEAPAPELEARDSDVPEVQSQLTAVSDIGRSV